MAQITGYTAARMKQIEDETVVSGRISGGTNLLLTTRAGVDIDAGYVKGDKGDKGDTGLKGDKGDKGDTGLQAPAPPWVANTAYGVGAWVLSPFGEVVKSKTARTSRASYDSTEAANWAGVDRIMTFTTAAAFNWSGGIVNWDAGPLVVDNSAGASALYSNPMPAHTAPGSVSGALKFMEPGVFNIEWWHLSGTDPGLSGYRINTYGSWPGPLDSQWTTLGQTYRAAGNLYWESMIIANDIRVPAAGLEVRLQGNQTNSTNAFPKVRVRKVSSI